MTAELKSMFGQLMREPSLTEMSEKQSKEIEEKKMKEYIKKQGGMKKELIKLIGGVPSITSTNTSKVSRKGEVGQEWVWSAFNNPGRDDGFKLSHWQRKEDIDKDYEFAHCNSKRNLIEFSQDEYNSLPKPNDNNWTYEETVYFWQLLQRFDLRFTVVYDRYDETQYPSRTIEELKERYYSLSRKVLEQRKVNDHPILRSGYIYEHEMKRRAYLERTLNRSNEEMLSEAHLLKQAAEIEKQLNKYEKIEESLRNTNFEQKPGLSFEEFVRGNATENDSFVYLRSQKMKHNLPFSDKIQHKVDEFIKELNLPEKLTPTPQVEVAYDTLRNNIVLYTSLKKYLEKKEKEYILLDTKLRDIQNKKSQHSQLLIPMAAGHDYDVMSVASSKTKEKKIKANTPMKAKKVSQRYNNPSQRKGNDESESLGSGIKKTKKSLMK